eukprot:2201431-Amphidinium_carterae.2
MKKHREEHDKQKQQRAEEAERIRKMNEEAGLPHLSAGLKLDLLQQHDALVNSNEPLPGPSPSIREGR